MITATIADARRVAVASAIGTTIEWYDFFIYIGPQPAVFAELFPPPVRYSGASLSITIGTIFGGPIAPFLATALYGAVGSSWPITIYIVALSVISWICSLGLKDTWGKV